MSEYNEKLLQWIECKPSPDAGVGNIQIPGDVTHLIWQNRYREPTEYEIALTEHLERAFANGAVELKEVVEALNSQGLRNEAGEVWTEDNFQGEMSRLGY